jgi:hypothetical protein
MSRISPMPGDLRAAVQAVAGDGEVQHVGRDQAVVHDVGALRRRARDEGRGHRRRRQPHVAADADAPRAEVRREGAADGVGPLLVDLVGIGPPHVVGLEDVGMEIHGCRRAGLPPQMRL